MKYFTVRVQSNFNKIRHSPVSCEISDFRNSDFTPCAPEMIMEPEFRSGLRPEFAF